MCLLLLAIDVVPDRPWLLLGNRDEFHARASARAAVWSDRPDIVGGRDLVAGGTWLALHRDGRFAAVTNVRAGLPARAPRSRGELVAGFLAAAVPARDYIAAIAARCAEYGPFNLIVGERGSVWGLSSVDVQPWRFASGVHVLSNGAPDAQWPKVQRLRASFSATLAERSQNKPAAAEPRSQIDSALLDLLADTQLPADEDLPDTGVGLALERTLAPIFIRGTTYGTRASTLAYTRADASCVLIERSFGPAGVALGEERIEMAA